MNKYSTATLLLSLISYISFSQSKTTLSKNKVKGATEIEIKNNISIAQTKEFFDANGEIIEDHKFDKIGKLKSVHKYTRNKTGDVTEENIYDSKSKLKERRAVKHNQAGQKLEESFYDSKNLLTKVTKYFYDDKGLKIEKKTFDAKGNLKKVNKYTYQF
ncbi:MAG: hypothetical protein WCO37_11075 [Bacteroidota bacterium]|jgi:Ni,Fe-hydrogenase I large subunit